MTFPTFEDRKPQEVDRSLLEYLKPKAEGRYSKLEAYCDLLSRAATKTYSTSGAEGTMLLLRGQFIASISELARQWQWQRATVRQFIIGLINLGQVSITPYSKNFIFSINLQQRLSFFVESSDDVWDFCNMQFLRFVHGRIPSMEVGESFKQYCNMMIAVLNQNEANTHTDKSAQKLQTDVFNSLAFSVVHLLGQDKDTSEELSDTVSLLFGKDHVWDWHKVMDTLGIIADSLRQKTKPSCMSKVTDNYTKGEVILIDNIYKHYLTIAKRYLGDNVQHSPKSPQEGSNGYSLDVSSSIENVGV